MLLKSAVTNQCAYFLRTVFWNKTKHGQCTVLRSDVELSPIIF